MSQYSSESFEELRLADYAKGVDVVPALTAAATATVDAPLVKAVVKPTKSSVCGGDLDEQFTVAQAAWDRHETMSGTAQKRGFEGTQQGTFSVYKMLDVHKVQRAHVRLFLDPTCGHLRPMHQTRLLQYIVTSRVRRCIFRPKLWASVKKKARDA